RLQRVLPGHTEAVNSVAFSADGTRVVSGSMDGSARVWDAGSGKLLQEFKHKRSVISVAFSPDGARVLTASSEGMVRIWNATGGNPRELKVAPDRREFLTRQILKVTFSADGMRVLTATQFSRPQVWDLASGKIVGELKGHTNPLSSAAISSDGTRAITAGTE